MKVNDPTIKARQHAGFKFQVNELAKSIDKEIIKIILERNYKEIKFPEHKFKKPFHK